MSQGDSSDPATLCILNSEVQAAMLVAELNVADIFAVSSGGLTAGFRAEAPGRVKVLVPAERYDEAKALYAEWIAGVEDIDWDDVDLGEFEDGAPPAD
ncbi:MAG: hypothetical protein AAF663_05295 [Planctomycetota bacterium]